MISFLYKWGVLILSGKRVPAAYIKVTKKNCPLLIDLESVIAFFNWVI